MSFRGQDRTAHFEMAVGEPPRPEAEVKADFHAGKPGGKPRGDRFPAAFHVSGQEQVTNDKPGRLIGPEQVCLYGFEVGGDARDSPGAGVVAEFVVGDPDIKHAFEQLAGFGRGMGIRFPNECGGGRERCNKLED